MKTIQCILFRHSTFNDYIEYEKKVNTSKANDERDKIMPAYANYPIINFVKIPKEAAIGFFMGTLFNVNFLHDGQTAITRNTQATFIDENCPIKCYDLGAHSAFFIKSFQTSNVIIPTLPKDTYQIIKRKASYFLKVIGSPLQPNPEQIVLMDSKLRVIDDEDEIESNYKEQHFLLVNADRGEAIFIQNGVEVASMYMDHFLCVERICQRLYKKGIKAHKLSVNGKHIAGSLYGSNILSPICGLKIDIIS